MNTIQVRGFASCYFEQIYEKAIQDQAEILWLRQGITGFFSKVRRNDKQMYKLEQERVKCTRIVNVLLLLHKKSITTRVLISEHQTG